ncbi:MAG TPA: NAD(P)/FAD-dependent oxidoreductase [Vicinamibacterales bacterium]
MIAASSPTRDEPVLVVGGGPAGATAARTLALAGVPVRLLDRAAFPRNKPCGGGISLRVTRRFPYLTDALPRISTHFVGRLHLEGPSGESAVVESDGPAALMVRRVEFDALLVALAVEAGAELVPGADVVRASDRDGIVALSTRDGRTFESPTVVAADGVHSTVARRLGLNPGWPATAVALDMMEETPRAALRDVDPSTLWVAYGYSPGDGSPTRAAPEGYAYIFPKRDHVNVGVGYVLQYYREHVNASPYDLQRRFVERLRARGIVDGASVRENFTPSLIPVGGPLQSPGRGGVLLAGDAGGFVNAFTAEGIYYAMVSGDLAARAIIDARRIGAGRADLAARYASACDEEIGAELRDSVLIQQYLFRDNTRIRAVIEAAPRSMVTRLILDFAVGRMSYRELRRRLFTRAPGLAARLAWELLRKKTWPRARAAAII